MISKVVLVFLLGCMMLGVVAGDCVDSQDTCIHWAGLGYCDGGIYKVCCTLVLLYSLQFVRELCTLYSYCLLIL